MKLSFDTKNTTPTLAHNQFNWSPIHPHRDWVRLLTIFSVLVFIAVVWSTYLYFSSAKEISEALVAVEEDGEVTVKLKSITSETVDPLQ